MYRRGQTRLFAKLYDKYYIIFILESNVCPLLCCGLIYTFIFYYSFLSAFCSLIPVNITSCIISPSNLSDKIVTGYVSYEMSNPYMPCQWINICHTFYGMQWLCSPLLHVHIYRKRIKVICFESSKSKTTEICQ